MEDIEEDAGATRPVVLSKGTPLRYHVYRVLAALEPVLVLLKVIVVAPGPQRLLGDAVNELLTPGHWAAEK